MNEEALIGLFATPLYKSRVDVDPSINDDYLKSLPYFNFPDGTGACSRDQKILLNPKFESLKKEIDKHVNIYLYGALKIAQGKPKHIQSWITLHKENQASPKHLHSNSFISGGVYFECPPDCGRLNFAQTKNNPSWHTGTIVPQVSENNLFNSDTVGFDVERGDIFIFPSHLLHSTGSNRSGKDRYMVAFNYFLEGTIGRETGEISLRVS